MPKVVKGRKRRCLCALVLLFILAGCNDLPGGSPASTSPVAPPPATTVPAHSAGSPGPTAAIPAPRAWTVWLSPAVPGGLRDRLSWPENAGESRTQAKADYELVVLQRAVSGASLQPAKREPAAQGKPAGWVYVLVAPFPTVLDGVSLDALQDAWRGKPVEALAGSPLLMERSTHDAFTLLWGPASPTRTQVLAADKLLERAWQERSSWALVPFEELDPRWKVLRVDGVSPLEQDFNSSTYPLTVYFGLRAAAGGQRDALLLPDAAAALLPATNRDPEKMTTLVMTGVTALVRGTALRMEEKGVTYPAQDIVGWLRDADITHISNEVAFDENCPPARPLRREMRFCSAPGYIELLQYAGADVIELTGNHLLDWGAEPFLATLDLYRQRGLQVYGGGADKTDARQPLILEHHGNRLALIGCNPAGPENVLATDTTPGAAPCDLDWMAQVVDQLRKQGVIPVVTFQHIEVEDVKPTSLQRHDFVRIAEAGAAIVSGSQAHVAQTFAFSGDRLIHYGLGNLFFDQMEKWNRPAFIDRHILYDGRYVSTELLTVMLEDAARPRPMTAQERAGLLQEAFTAAGW